MLNNVPLTTHNAMLVISFKEFAPDMEKMRDEHFRRMDSTKRAPDPIQGMGELITYIFELAMPRLDMRERPLILLDQQIEAELLELYPGTVPGDSHIGKMMCVIRKLLELLPDNTDQCRLVAIRDQLAFVFMDVFPTEPVVEPPED